jgi:molybdenum cofactor guanylyltransferase
MKSSENKTEDAPVLPTILGVLVGGRSIRMGGVPKGLLRDPVSGETLVARAVRIAREAAMKPVLVGTATAYVNEVTHVEVLHDEPGCDGPLGGMMSLLRYAGKNRVIVLACDMPFVSLEHVRALAQCHPDAPCVAARSDPTAPWEPFFARYDPTFVLPIATTYVAEGGRSMQQLLVHLGTVAWPINASITADWDTPDDVNRCRIP